jgi:hypothetical protein
MSSSTKQQPSSSSASGGGEACRPGPTLMAAGRGIATPPLPPGRGPSPLLPPMWCPSGASSRSCSCRARCCAARAAAMRCSLATSTAG